MSTDKDKIVKLMKEDLIVNESYQKNNGFRRWLAWRSFLKSAQHMPPILEGSFPQLEKGTLTGKQLHSQEEESKMNENASNLTQVERLEQIHRPMGDIDDLIPTGQEIALSDSELPKEQPKRRHTWPK